MILPIMVYHFNIIGIYFLITNLLVSVIIGPIIILGIFCIISFLLFEPITQLFVSILNGGLSFLDFISKFSQLPFSKIYVPTPSIISIILYFGGVLFGKQIYLIYYSSSLRTTQKRIRNLIALFQYKFHQKKKKYLSGILIILILLVSIGLLPKDLRIYFVDVGQGDCTFIVTPQNKTILIDGGGSLTDEFNVGKRILIPYLLDRGYTTIDYIMISHFDRRPRSDGVLTIMKELKVKNVIIGKQFENSENYQEFIKIMKEKNTNIKIVESGNRIEVERGLYFDVLWPSSSNVILENTMNNNALVCKLNNRNFSMLFTGDIEKEAENVLIKKYKGTDTLKSNILKVAHHGSNSSSTEEFLKLVNPKIAFIGVGENNIYKHPSDEVLQRLENLRY